MLSIHWIQVSVNDITTTTPLSSPLAIASIDDCFVVADGC